MVEWRVRWRNSSMAPSPPLLFSFLHGFLSHPLVVSLSGPHSHPFGFDASFQAQTHLLNSQPYFQLALRCRKLPGFFHTSLILLEPIAPPTFPDSNNGISELSWIILDAPYLWIPESNIWWSVAWFYPRNASSPPLLPDYWINCVFSWDYHTNLLTEPLPPCLSSLYDLPLILFKVYQIVSFLVY